MSTKWSASACLRARKVIALLSACSPDTSPAICPTNTSTKQKNGASHYAIYAGKTPWHPATALHQYPKASSSIVCPNLQPISDILCAFSSHTERSRNNVACRHQRAQLPVQFLAEQVERRGVPLAALQVSASVMHSMYCALDCSKLLY